MPRMEATDRSISPLMMISVIGSVMIAISPLDRPTLNRWFPVRKLDEADEPMTAIATTTMASPDSQRSAGRSRSARLFMAGPPQPQGAGETLGDGLVECDREQQQRAPDRLVPERRYAQDVQRRADRGKQQRAEPGADDAAAAAEDRDTADHHRGYHRKLVAGAGGGVDRAVLGAPEHARDACDGAA